MVQQKGVAPVRVISLYGLTMVAVGACIGAGIFFVPQMIAGYLSSPLLILCVWGLGSFVALCGALTFSELAGMFTGDGGQYDYLKQAFGPFFGFSLSWLYITVINPGAIASLSIVFATYFLQFVQLPESLIIFKTFHISTSLFVSATVILFTSFINILHAKASEIFTSFFSTLKLIGIAIIVFIGLYFGTEQASVTLSVASHSFHEPSLNLFSAFGLAFVGVWFSVGGWQHASWLVSEVKNPARNVPLAMVLGTVIVGLFYISVNLAYLYLMSPEELYRSSSVAADAVSRVTMYGGTLLSVIISVSTLGTIAICTFSAPRLAYAIARDKLFFQSFSGLHSRYKTPVVAILSQTGMALVLLLGWRTFADIVTNLVFADVLITLLTGAAVVYLRFKKPNLYRPYKTWGYPYTTFIFLIITSAFAVNTIIQKPMNTLVSFIFILIGYFVYSYFQKKQRNKN